MYIYISYIYNKSQGHRGRKLDKADLKVLLQHWWHQLKIVPKVISPNLLVLEQPGCWLTPGPSQHGAQCVAAALARGRSNGGSSDRICRGRLPEQGPVRYG